LRARGTARKTSPSPEFEGRVHVLYRRPADLFARPAGPITAWFQFAEGGRMMADFTDVDPGGGSRSGWPCAWSSASRKSMAPARLHPLFLEGGHRSAVDRRAPQEGIEMAIRAIRDKGRNPRHGLLEIRRALGCRGRRSHGRGPYEGGARRFRDRNRPDRGGVARERRSRSSMSGKVGRAARPVALRLPYIPVTRVENYIARQGSEAFRGRPHTAVGPRAPATIRAPRSACEKLKDTGLWRNCRSARRGRAQLDVLGQCLGARQLRANSPPPTAPKHGPRPRRPQAGPWRISR